MAEVWQILNGARTMRGDAHVHPQAHALLQPAAVDNVQVGVDAQVEDLARYDAALPVNIAAEGPRWSTNVTRRQWWWGSGCGKL